MPKKRSIYDEFDLIQLKYEQKRMLQEFERTSLKISWLQDIISDLSDHISYTETELEKALNWNGKTSKDEPDWEIVNKNEKVLEKMKKEKQ